MSVTQLYRPLAVATPLGEDVLLLEQMTGSEALGRLFEFRLRLLSERRHVPIERTLGQNVTLRVALPGGGQRYFNGYVSECARGEDVGRFSRFEMTLRPWLWFLTQTADCRIFQRKTVPEIVEEVFRAHGFSSFDEALFHEYRPLEYCVQYRETDFNFVSRLLEQAGIYYFFRHENGAHTLVLCDDGSSHGAEADYEQVPYFPYDPDARRERDHIYRWTSSHRFRPAAYALGDFDFERPTAQLGVSTALSAPHEGPALEIFDFPGGYVRTDAGEQQARVHLERLHAEQAHASAEGDVRGLAAGTLFHLGLHPQEEQNREYLVVSASYHLTAGDYDTGGGAADDDAFRTALTVIDAARPFRTARVTAKPVMPGPQTATVVGKDGAEIYTDEHGRVKVQFHWDRRGQGDEHSSCWVRVAQVAAGKGFGAINLPRVGQEVVIDFVEGDPDRPIATGRLFNGTCKPPYGLPDNATISTFKSNSTGNGGFNELRFQDLAGEEQVFLHAQKDLDVRVRNDRYDTVGRDAHLVVERDQKEHVGVDRHETICRDHQEKIGRDRHTRINGKQAVRIGASSSLTVCGDMVEVLRKNHCHEVTKNYFLKAEGIVLESLTGITIRCGAASIVLDPAGVTISGPTVVVDGAQTRINSGPGSTPAVGEPIRAVNPAPPESVIEADVATAGSNAPVTPQRPGEDDDDPSSNEVRPYVPPSGDEPRDEDSTWVEIELVDEEGRPVPGEPFEILLPDGSLATGTTDVHGIGRIDGIDPGQCRVSFHQLDEEAWEPA